MQPNGRCASRQDVGHNRWPTLAGTGQPPGGFSADWPRSPGPLRGERTMARLKLPEREGLPPEGQQAWDHVMASRGHIGGPFTVLVHSPELGKRASDVGAYVRFESGLPK